MILLTYEDVMVSNGYWVSTNGGTPTKWVVYFMENPMNKDDLFFFPILGQPPRKKDANGQFFGGGYSSGPKYQSLNLVTRFMECITPLKS